MQDVADQSVAPTTIGADLLRNICLIGTEPIDLAGHIAVARPRGEDVKAKRVRRGYRCAAGALFGAREESVRADRKILPDYRHSRSGVGRLPDSPCRAE
jgi:hypothetical protein